jgi:hypothetical protein
VEKRQAPAVMATRISLANVARASAGIVAALWALLGMLNAFAAASGRGFDPLVVVEIIVNAALLASAVLAFTNLRNWRPIMIGAVLLVTTQRIVDVLRSGEVWLALPSVAMLAAVVLITVVAKQK